MNKYERYKKVDLPWLEEVPEHWELVKINILFEERREKVSDKDFEALSVTKMGVTKQLANVAKTIASDNRKKVLKDDFVINSRSDRKGSSGVSNFDGSVSLINTVLKIRKDNVRFIHYLMRSVPFQEEFYRYGKGIVADLWSTNFQSMKNILLPIPSLYEQEKIAAYLDWKINEIDRLIAVEKEKILELQRLLSTKVDRIFDDLLRVSVSKIRMRFLYEFQNGISTSKDYTNGEFPFLTYSDVYNNLIVPEKLGGRINSDGKEQEIYSIDEGDLFVTRTSERIEDAGKVSLALHKVENAVFNGFTIRLHPKANNNFLAKFILYYLNSAIVREKIINSLNLVTRVSIKQEILKEVSVPVVSIEEQQHTVESIEELSNTFQSEIASLQSKINYFSSLKHSLISEVVTGKIDVRNVVIPIYEKVDVSVSTNEEEVEE